MKLKRILAVLLVVCMMMPLVACKDGDSTVTTTAPDDTATTTTVAQGVVSDTDEVISGSDEVTTATDEQGDVVTVPGETQATEPGETEAQGGNNTQAQSGNKTTQAQQGGNKTTQAQQGGNKTTQAQGGNATTQAQQQGGTTTRATKSKVSLNIQTQPSKGTSASLAHVTVKEGDKKMEEGLNFGGKTFRFCSQGSSHNPESDYGKMVTAYCEEYNLKLDIDVASLGEYPAHVAAAMAAGTPYDIMFLYGWNYPSQIMSNAMTPLDDYISTADLWNEKSMKEGGISYSLADTFSLNGKIYCVGGTYLQTAFVVWYNKKLFAAAGYDGADDPLALYNKGQWTWDKLYEMLQDIQDPDKGLYGLNSVAPYYDHPFICTYDTDFAKRTDDGKVVQNLSDPQLYAAYNMLQKLCFGKQKVADPSNQYESGSEQFMNGTIAACTGTAGWAWDIYKKMDAKHYSAFGSQAEQKKNVGMVPAPVANKNGVHAIWDWMGYGAGNGATEEGIKAAIAFAKWDSKYNQKQAYHPDMPADIKAAALAVLDSDKLRGPMDGYKSSAGSLGGIGTSISEAIARSGGNITVTLKGYEKMAQTVVDTALKH